MANQAKPAATVLAIPTRYGTFTATYSARGLAALDFPRPGKGHAPRSPGAPMDIRRWHALATQAVQAVLAGRTPAELPPLDLSAGTAFQQLVWEELSLTPCGETRSYGEIAKAIRQSKASRAVGGACGSNPIPLLIPCHRVLAANHRIGGFSGGLDWKKRLLSIEGVNVA